MLQAKMEPLPLATEFYIALVAILVLGWIVYYAVKAIRGRRIRLEFERDKIGDFDLLPIRDVILFGDKPVPPWLSVLWPANIFDVWLVLTDAIAKRFGASGALLSQNGELRGIITWHPSGSLPDGLLSNEETLSQLSEADLSETDLNELIRGSVPRHRLEIDLLVIDPAVKNPDIAKQLVSWVLDWANLMGFSEIAAVSPDNTRILPGAIFWEDLGFGRSILEPDVLVRIIAK